MTAPLAFPSVAQFDGVAKEDPDNPGTPVAMTMNVPLETDLKWEDKPLYIPDKGLRGDMANDSYHEVQGVYYCDVTAMGGSIFLDSFPFLLGNILGDYTGTATAAPYKHQFSLLNPTAAAPTAQPTTLTWTHYDGLTPTVGARQIPYFCLSELVIEWEVATGLLMWSGKGQGLRSVPAGARPVSSPSAVKPIAAWEQQCAVGGTIAGGQTVANLEKLTLTLTRELELEYTGGQNPLMVARGGLSSSLAATYLAQDMTYYTDNQSNTQPQLQALFSVGAGAALASLQIDVQQYAMEKTTSDGSKKMLRWDTSGKPVLNSTNTGTSGGRGPAQITVQNAVTTGSYV